MSSSDTWNDLIQEASALVRAAAHPQKGTIALSPEVARRLMSLDGEPVVPGRVSAVEETRTPEKPSLEIAAWEALENQVRQCTLCALCNTRKQTVFGVGNRSAEVVLVGEAPGEDEDRQGEPFVGAAGRLLTDIIVKGMKMRREDVYICNVLKCRPPGNRTPGPDEIPLCLPYLERQLDLIHPKVIGALGGVAAQTLLRTQASVGSMRGKWLAWKGIPVRVTYHPSYLIRQKDPERLKQEKQKVWMDVQAVLRVLSGEEKPVIQP